MLKLLSWKSMKETVESVSYLVRDGCLVVESV